MKKHVEDERALRGRRRVKRVEELREAASDVLDMIVIIAKQNFVAPKSRMGKRIARLECALR